jgi:hypothetical protein
MGIGSNQGNRSWTAGAVELGLGDGLGRPGRGWLAKWTVSSGKDGEVKGVGQQAKGSRGR